MARIVEIKGRAKIHRLQQVDRARVLSEVYAGDTLIVSTGSLSYRDLGSGRLKALHGRESLVFAALPDAKRPHKARQILAFLVGIVTPDPPVLRTAAVKGECWLWPNDVAFVDSAAIELDWRCPASPHMLTLWDPKGTAHTTGLPTTPLVLDSLMSRSAGSYEWQLEDSSGKVLGRARFVVLTKSEVALELQQWRKEARDVPEALPKSELDLYLAAKRGVLLR